MKSVQVCFGAATNVKLYAYLVPTQACTISLYLPGFLYTYPVCKSEVYSPLNAQYNFTFQLIFTYLVNPPVFQYNTVNRLKITHGKPNGLKI